MAGCTSKDEVYFHNMINILVCAKYEKDSRSYTSHHAKNSIGIETDGTEI